MKNGSWKIYAKILLCLLVPFTIIFYCYILPSVEKEYSGEYNYPNNEKTDERVIENVKNDDEINIIQEKDVSSFSKYMTNDEMMSLESALKKIDSENTRDLQKITSIFLESMGYPSNLIKIEYQTTNGAKFEGDIQAGSFMPSSGKLAIHQQIAQMGDIKEVTSIIRHELDHFDKFAKLCKSIGIDNFQKMYGGNINREFWENAILYVDLTGFDKNKFLKAASVMNEYTDITSFYQLFVEKSNDVRNPFELTAYSFTDYVNAHYKINKGSETNVKKVAKVFNSVDWQIYKIANNNKYLSRSRSAIFDYYFLRAMLTYNPNMKTAYQNAVKNGNITGFWEECEKIADGLKNNVLSTESTNNIIKILNSMNLAMNQTITNKHINGILQLKYITLKDAAKNPKYSNFRGNLAILLGINVNDYLDFLNIYSSENDNMKLKLLASKYWLSTIRVQKQEGGFYNFTNNESTPSIEGKIRKEKHFKEAQKASGLDENKYFQEFIMKNKLFP